jgi:hypothetical protein
MRSLLLLLLLALSVACGDDPPATTPPSSTASSGGTGGANGSGGSGGSSGAAGATAGASGSSGAPSCTPDAPVAARFSTLEVDLPIASIPTVTYDLAVAHATAIPGFVLAYNSAAAAGIPITLVVARSRQPGIELDITIGALDAGLEHVNAGAPSLAVGKGGADLVAVWSDDRAGSGNGPQSIHGQFFDASPAGLAKRGANFRISTQAATNDWRPHVVHHAASGRYWVAWADDRSFATQDGGRFLYARSLSSDGTLGPDLMLGDGMPWQDGVRAAATAGRLLFVWGELVAGADPFVARHRARFLDPSSGALSEPLALFEAAGANLVPAGVASDPARCRILVIWQESANQQIWGTLIDETGKSLRPRFQITSDPEGAGTPKLVFSAASASFLMSYSTWQSSEARLLELDAEGNPLGAARSVHGTPPTNGTYAHDLAAGGREALSMTNEDYERIEAALARDAER